MKNILSYLFGILFIQTYFGQNPPVIIKLTNESNVVNVQNVASNKIDLLPGYSYKPVFIPGFVAKMDAYIDSYFPVGYLNSSSDYNFERELNTSLPVGSINGGGSVSSSGSSNYSIPLEIPKGINGLMPSLDISYNSHAQNNSLGFGWALSGLSSISRTPQSFYYDNRVNKINFNDQDRLALDGNRLVYQAGTGSGYGTNGSEYLTNQETYSLIKGFDNDGLPGLDYFVVTTKEGMQLEFSNKYFTSTFEAPLAWRLTKVTDLHGNYMEYFYDYPDGVETLLSEIKYTGNNNGLAPFCSVKFYYKEREDMNKSYINGGYLESNSLLEFIEVWSENDLVRKYEMKYGFNLHSFLYEIIQYGSDGTYFNSTKFDYGTPQSENSSVQLSLQGFSSEPADYLIGDYNGDGISDIMAFTYTFIGGVKTHNSWKVYLNNGNGYDMFVVNSALPANFIPFDPKNKYSELPNYNMGLEIFDMNGDGIDDVMVGERLAQYFIYHVYYSNGDGTFTQDAQPIQVQFDHELTVGDFDGDKYLDVLVYNRFPNNNQYVWQVFFFDEGTNDTESTYVPYFGSNIVPQPEGNFIPIDFNGDGKTNILTTRGNDRCVFEIIVTPSYDGNNNYLGKRIRVVEIYKNNYPNVQDLAYTGDFNGDGVTDILSVSGNPTIANWWKGMGTGKTNNLNVAYDVDAANNLALSNPFSDSSNFYILNPGNTRFILDVNGDGKADIVQLVQTVTVPITYLSIYLSNGNAFYPYTIELPFVYNHYSSTLRFGDFDGDGSMDLMHERINVVHIISIFQDPNKNLLSKVLDGYNNLTTLDYKTMSDKSNPIYTKGSSASYPIIDIQVPLYVVNEIGVENGIGGRNTTNYQYSEATVHRRGKGFLGFKEIIEFNTTHNVKKVTTYQTDNVFFDTQLIEEKIYVNSTNQLVSIQTYDYEKIDIDNDPLVIAPRFKVQLIESESENFITALTNKSIYEYDNFGNIVESTTSAGGTIEASSTSTVYSAVGSSIPNKPIEIIIRNQRQGDGLYQREVHHTYNTVGDVTQIINDPSHQNPIVTDFTYDNYGNVTSKTIASPNLATTFELFSYDANHRFIISQTNALGHTEHVVMDYRLGVPLTSTSITGLVTNFNYDGFGRLIKTEYPDGNESEVFRNWLSNNTSTTSGQPFEADDVLFEIVTRTTGKPTSIAQYNSVGHIRKTIDEGFKNDILTITTYNERGLTHSQTAPFYQGQQNIDLVSTSYDELSRAIGITSGRGSSTIEYQNNGATHTTSITDMDGKVTTKTTDKSGRVINTTDDGGILEYLYSSNGKQKQVTLNGTIVSEAQYDNKGNQISLNDPNAGNTYYEYNALGQLKKQTNANGNEDLFAYDVLGRMVERTSAEGIYLYEYVSAGNGLGMLNKSTAPNGSYTKFEYDNLNRVINHTEYVDGASYTNSYQFDQFNNPIHEILSSGLELKRAYNSKGYLTKVMNHDESITYWEVNEVNAFGKITESTRGNGVVSTLEQNHLGFVTRISAGSFQDLELNYDFTNGNLLSRTDHTKSLVETFQYDALNRLTQIQLGTNQPYTISYEQNGNISNKYDVGDYTYDNTKVNAVLEVENTQNIINLNTQQLTYSSFHSPLTIEEGDFQLTMSYGADDQRRKSILKYQGVDTKTIVYAGNTEYITDALGNETKVNYIQGGGGIVACLVQGNNTTELYYTYFDQLGSLVTLTDDQGNIVYEQNFDAWGRNRNAQDWSYDNIIPQPFWLIRGYTFHENLYEFGLINMNGRVYDPILGRMLSPDNYVQSPDNSQSYNRYSYVWNNPLKYSDPDGELVHLALGGLRGGVTSYFEGRAAGLEGWQLAGYTALGTAMGVASAAINPASVAGHGFYVKPDVAGGSNGGGIGLEVGYNFGVGKVGEFSVSSAVYYSARHQGSGVGGFYGRNTVSAGVNIGKIMSIEYAVNQYSGSGFSQTTGGLRIGFGGKNSTGKRWAYLTYENDFMFKLPADNGDRYRTAAMRLDIYAGGNTPYSIGWNVFTGDPGLEQGQKRKNNSTYHTTGIHAGRDVYNEDHPYRLGSLYVGYGNLKVGIDSEQVRHAIQNKGAHDAIGVPHFQVIDKKPSLYFYYGNSTNYSLWGY